MRICMYMAYMLLLQQNATLEVTDSHRVQISMIPYATSRGVFYHQAREMKAAHVI